MMRPVRFLVASLAFECALVVVPAAASAQCREPYADCSRCPDPDGTWTISGTTVTRGGTVWCDRIEVVGGGVLRVTNYNGTTRATTGNLVLVANEIFVDATSTISARGSGYRTALCADGAGPNARAGGRGGCSVRDSGGGGAHFGPGGRGTKDCFIVDDDDTCQFPWEFEHDCNQVPNGGGNACVTGGTGGGHGCWVQNGNERPISSALVSTCGPPPASCSSSTCCYNPEIPIRGTSTPPTVAGSPYFHSVWAVEFGSSGGDKGCRDGFDSGGGVAMAGSGGGRIVLAGTNAGGTGSVRIDGTLNADGRRGCGLGNDSAGGGAGGTVLVLADDLVVGAEAAISAAGGLGGDTNAKSGPNGSDCPAAAQDPGGTCDDCGGGGGGGLVSIRSRVATIDPSASFDVSGANGGVCPICAGEAGGGSGELQINVAYVGEECDGYDNDFDEVVDEGLGTVGCGLGPCAASIDYCTAGEPTECAPEVTGATCQSAPVCNEPRIAVVLDTSASMLQDLAGYATFGDGSTDHPGLDTNDDGQPNDSRLFLAKEALGQVISNFPEIDFSLARYHQDQALEQSCQLASWIECAGIFATYDDPTDNTGPVSCSVPVGPSESVTVRRDSTDREECINYAGSCGAPRRGADVLAGFGTDPRDVVRWLDGRETDFRDVETVGNVCEHMSGGDCELRATGPTPLAGALQSVQDFVLPVRAVDPCTACRGYTVLLVTDGAESCGGDPVAAAAELHDVHGIDVFVVAVSVLPEEEAALNALARAGSGDAQDATFVRNPEELVPALTSVVAGSIRFESCNGADDDCDGEVDEGFTGLGSMCNDGGIGACRGEGAIQCREDGAGTRCVITSPGDAPMEEVCNDADDDCDGRLDEGLTCTGGSECVPDDPPTEVCDGRDNNCNGVIDESDPTAGTPCESDEGECRPGTLQCVAGELECVGFVGPRDELCNGLDDDCDGVADDFAECPGETRCVEANCRRPCDPSTEFPCPPGLECREAEGAEGSFCIPSPCAACAPTEVCDDDVCVDACAGVECDANESCIRGICRDCYTLGCEDGEVCQAAECAPNPCSTTTCDAGDSCFGGTCTPSCDDRECPTGERCDDAGACEPDPCAGSRCAAGEYCDEGTCRDDPCVGLECPRGHVCASSMGCIPDPCVLVRCEAGRVCRTGARGAPRCVVDGPIVRPDTDFTRVWASGGGGSSVCAASPGQRGMPLTLLLWLVPLALVVRRRTR